MDLKAAIREAYLAHRLNRPELAGIVARLQASKPEEAQELFETYSKLGVNWRGGVETDAPGFLGLQAEFEKLDESRPWSREERALYRRLAAPDFDPDLEVRPPATGGDPALVGTALENFEQWDKNHNLRLESDELDQAMSRGVVFGYPSEDPQYNGKEAATLVILRSYPELGAFMPSDGNGVSQADLIRFGLAALPNSGGFIGLVNEKFQELLKGLPAPGSVATENFDPAALQQGKAGSCVFLATALGLPEQQLRSLIEATEDGLFRVRFADGAEERVGDVTYAERLYHSRTVDGGRWPALLEMAMAQRLFSEQRPEDNSLRSLLDGVPVESAIPALTGLPAVRVNLDETSVAEVRGALEAMQPEQGGVVCGSRPQHVDPLKIDVETLENGIANNHAYAVLGYDRARDVVLLQNPWRTTEWRIDPDGLKDGRFEMPLKHWYSSFRWLAGPQR